VSQIDHLPHLTIKTGERLEPTLSPKIYLHEEFPFDDTLFTPGSTNSIPASCVNIIDSILNEIPLDDEYFESQDDALIIDEFSLRNSSRDHHTNSVIHCSTKLIGTNAYFDYPPRFDHGWHHCRDPISLDNPIMTKVENHDNLHELLINHAMMTCCDMMIKNDKVVFSRSPLESKLYTFEDDP